MAKKVQPRIFGMLVVCILVAACGGSGADTEPVLKDAWIRALPTGAGMTAGFGTLENPGPAAIEIRSFTSPSFGDVSLHRTELVDGVSKMREVPVLSIAAGSRVVLEPGGYHLMLMMPAEEILPGKTVTIEMEAADGRRFNFNVPVERR
jgi:copper(I)-binding protein